MIINILLPLHTLIIFIHFSNKCDIFPFSPTPFPAFLLPRHQDNRKAQEVVNGTRRRKNATSFLSIPNDIKKTSTYIQWYIQTVQYNLRKYSGKLSRFYCDKRKYFLQLQFYKTACDSQALHMLLIYHLPINVHFVNKISLSEILNTKIP